MHDEFEQHLTQALRNFHYGAYAVFIHMGGELSERIVYDFILTYTAGCPPYDNVLRND